jgi:hypothetical protein
MKIEGSTANPYKKNRKSKQKVANPNKENLKY